MRMPTAEKLAGARGTTTVAISSSWATNGRKQAAAAAIGEHDEIARIEAALDRERPDGVDHVGLGDRQDAVRRLFEAEALVVGDPAPHRPCRPPRHRASCARRESCPGQAGRAPGGSRSPSAPCRRGRSRRDRASPRRSAGRPAPRRPRRSRRSSPPPAPIDMMSMIGPMIGRPPTFVSVRLQDGARLDQGDVIGGAADIGADDVGVSELGGERLRGDDAARRARFERADRPDRRALGGDDAAVRLHERQRPLEALRFQPRRQASEIAARRAAGCRR